MREQRPFIAPPPVINMRSQAEVDARRLDATMNSAGAYLDPANPQRPSGQFLQDRLRPALQWRVEHLACQDSLRLLARYEV